MSRRPNQRHGVARAQVQERAIMMDADSMDNLGDEPSLGIVDKQYLTDKRFADFQVSAASKR